MSTNKGMKYMTRLNVREVTEIRARFDRGDSIAQLAAKYARPYDTIRGIVTGRSYRNLPQPAASECASCEEASVAADNVTRANLFTGDVRCVRCKRVLEGTAATVHARQGRIVCANCDRRKS